MSEKVKAMTVRLPAALYRAGARFARRRRISMSRLLQESLQEALRREQRSELYLAFEQLGDAEEAADVEFAAPAQAEVLEDAEG